MGVCVEEVAAKYVLAKLTTGVFVKDPSGLVLKIAFGAPVIAYAYAS
jgi:hypothetical protein